MKISELIRSLNSKMEEFGDLPVYISQIGLNGVYEIEEDEIYKVHAEIIYLEQGPCMKDERFDLPERIEFGN